MTMCIKLARWAGLLFGKVAIILVLLGVVAFLMRVINDGVLFNVANFWNYLIASIPFSLLSICCAMFVLMAKKE